MRVYLDHNATSPLRASAKGAADAAMMLGGNASAMYQEGRRARAIIEEARASLARLVGSEAKMITFTSGGSEAANTLLTPGFGGAKALLVSSIEHSCILAGGRFAPAAVGIIPVLPTGIVDLAALDHLLAEAPKPCLVALMLANNETGIIQPVTEAAKLVQKHGGLLVVDAVQALGKIAVNMADLQADALIVSGHKIGSLPGVGAIIQRADACPTIPLIPLIRGGGQESNMRAGTENLPAIASFGAALEEISRQGASEQAKMAEQRDRLEADLLALSPEIVIFGRELNRLPNTSFIGIPNKNAETLLIGFDLKGVSLGAGSACTSGKMAQSHVLKAMGVDEGLAKGAIRLSLGHTTNDRELEFFASKWRELVVNKAVSAA